MSISNKLEKSFIFKFFNSLLSTINSKLTSNYRYKFPYY